MILQEVSDFLRVLAVAFHAQRQGFQPLHDQEGVERRQGGTGIAQGNHAAAANKGSRAEGVGVDHAVVRRVRLVQHRELVGTGFPVELAGVDHDPRHGSAVTADVLGERMNHYVRTVLKGTTQERRGDSVVHQ